MLTKIYWSIWAAVIATGGVIYLTGNLTALVVVAFGFLFFGLVFMGMMSVLPATISHPAPKRVESSNVKATPIEQPIAVLESIRTLKEGIMSTPGVEIRKPRFH